MSFIYKSTDPKVNKDRLVIMIDHYVVRLDITMNNTDHFVAVVQGLDHINKILFYLTRL